MAVDLETTLKMLNSINARARIQACEQLYDLNQSTPAIVAGLETAARDRDREVVAAAQRALNRVRGESADQEGQASASPSSGSKAMPPATPPPSPTSTEALLAEILGQQRHQTRLLRTISTAATLFTILVLLSIVLYSCNALIGGF